MRGSVYQRRDEITWTGHVEFKDSAGKRRQPKKGGFRLKREAESWVAKQIRSI